MKGTGQLPGRGNVGPRTRPALLRLQRDLSGILLVRPLPGKSICRPGALGRLTDGTKSHAGMGSFCLQLVEACRPLLLFLAGSKKTVRPRAHPGAPTASGPCQSGLEWPSRPAQARLVSLTRARVRSQRLRKFCSRTCRLFSWSPPETWICCEAVGQVRGLPAGGLTCT